MKSGQKNKFYYAINTRNLTAAVEIIKNDLKIQNICVASTTSRTTALALPTKYKVICFRIQTSNYSQTSDKAENDYHFMKYDRSSAAWLHKPGASAILKYKYTPSNSRKWKLEGVIGNEHACDPNTLYDSSIHYIVYSSSHSYSVKNQGDTSTHVLECDACSATKREAHILNASNSACRICGRSAPFTSVRINSADEILSIDVLLPSLEVLHNEPSENKQHN